MRPAAINLYKRLHRIGREYPDPKYNFLGKLRAASAKNAHETEEKAVRKWLDLGEFVYKGEHAMEFYGQRISLLTRLHAHI